MPKRLSRAVASNEYDFAIILAGSNDLGWNYAPASVYSSLRELWSITNAADIRTIACTVPPIGMDYPPIQAGQKELNRMILDESEARNDIVCVDVFAALADEKGLLPKKYDSGDGLHLNIEGYRCLGETIWLNGLKQLLREYR
jgi:lysophospholipase L1-like esterase